MLHFCRLIALMSCIALGLITLVGCNIASPPSAAPATTDRVQQVSKPSADPAKPGEEHGHKPAAHGGIIVPIGSDSYHAEAVFEKGGILRLYTLGQNEAVVLEVVAEPLTGFVKVVGSVESESFVLSPKPQPGDKAGMTSLFVGQLPKEAAGKKVEVTIPTIRIGSERFRIGFKSSADQDEHGMPAKLSDADEEKLYLTPGGKYTEADIKANGSTVASVKFKGLKAQHDAKPLPGDKLCPISMTKANPKFTWIIGGKTYEFCCPPCVDEFVELAKEKPAEIMPPEFYLQK